MLFALRVLAACICFLCWEGGREGVRGREKGGRVGRDRQTDRQRERGTKRERGGGGRDKDRDIETER